MQTPPQSPDESLRAATTEPDLARGHAEVGRWSCLKCGEPIVATAPGSSVAGRGAYVGPCPWACGAWIQRGFRGVRPGTVRLWRADEFDGAEAVASEPRA